MLILVVTVFLTIEIPLLGITALQAISIHTIPLMDYEVAGNVVLIVNTLTCLACPINLAIYCGMSKQFRKIFCEMFLTPLRNNN